MYGCILPSQHCRSPCALCLLICTHALQTHSPGTVQGNKVPSPEQGSMPRSRNGNSHWLYSVISHDHPVNEGITGSFDSLFISGINPLRKNSCLYFLFEPFATPLKIGKVIILLSFAQVTEMHLFFFFAYSKIKL